MVSVAILPITRPERSPLGLTGRLHYVRLPRNGFVQAPLRDIAQSECCQNRGPMIHGAPVPNHANRSLSKVRRRLKSVDWDDI
jgi:hypothetical protein